MFMDMQAQLKPAILGAIGGAAAIAIIGFGWGGWVTGGTADFQAKQRVVAALAPICVVQFQRAADAAVQLAELKKANTWSQPDFVEKAGWATMPGSTEPGQGVAKACVGLLTSLK
jgi:alpha/beta superfamily hydrolase